MTLEEMERSDKTILRPQDVAEVLGCVPYSINLQAQRDPAALGYPVIVTGTRVTIPREGFLYFMKYGRPVTPGNPSFKVPEGDGGDEDDTMVS